MSDRDNPTFDLPIIEVTVAAPAEQVWQALRDPAVIRDWFGWDTDTLAEEIAYIFFDHANASDTERIIRFGRGDRFEVEARGGQTVVRLVRAAPTADTDWEDVFEDEAQGWIAFVQQLRFALERHPGEQRRTLYFAGSPRASGDPLAAAALGLAGRAGESFSGSAAGVPIAGTVWHRGRHQIGLEVGEWGNGLLVVMDRPPSDRWPTGSSQVIATTYGISDGDFRALEARWSAWWDLHFGKSTRSGCD